MTYDAMLVDGKNSIYRAVFSGHSDKRFSESGHDYSVIMVRLLNSYLQKFKSKTVHVFWDVKKEGLWRRKILPEYKDGRNKDHGFDVEKTVNDCTRKCMKLFQLMGLSQYQMKRNEADDLIYAYIRANVGRGKCLIVSSDGDLTQIPYIFRDVDIYDPLKKRMIKTPDHDPVVSKCLMGDKSDNIDGYYNIGKKRSAKIASDTLLMMEFFDKKGVETYNRNRKLIDLGLCPDLLDNMNYVLRVMSEKMEFKADKIKKYISRVSGMTPEYTARILPFKFLKIED
jgi:5'-3' exonuclease